MLEWSCLDCRLLGGSALAISGLWRSLAKLYTVYASVSELLLVGASVLVLFPAIVAEIRCGGPEEAPPHLSSLSWFDCVGALYSRQ